MQDLTHSAIQASLNCNWEEAIDYNIGILATEPDNISALNRLAKAYTELDQKTSAKDIYEKVLKLDKYNSIALKSLKSLPNKSGATYTKVIDEDFIEEPGITRTVKLTKLASKNILLALVCKEPLKLCPRGRLISLQQSDKTHIGSLPDDLSLRLNRLLKSGYSYQTCVKATSDNQVTIFIRELKRPNRVTAAPSFSRKLKLKTLRKKSNNKS